MRSAPPSRSLAAAALLLAAARGPAAGQADAGARARRLYFSAGPEASAKAFEAAVRLSTADAGLWRDGAVAWEEAGRPDRALDWARRAAELSSTAEDRAALGWLLLRQARALAADEAFRAALAQRPEDPWTLLGAGRARLLLGKHEEASALLERAAAAAPGLTPAEYYLGKAREAAGDEEGAVAAWRRAVAADSHFHEGRALLGRAYLRQKRYLEAWRSFARLAEADPGSRVTRAILDKIRPLAAAAGAGARPPEPARPPGPGADSAGEGPVIRVGVSTTAMGRPKPRPSAALRGTGPWRALDPKTGRVLASGLAWQLWTVRAVPGRAARGKRKAAGARLELRGPSGEAAAAPRGALLFRPEDPAKGLLELDGGPGRDGRLYRGEIEARLSRSGRSLTLVNAVALEDYTHGVVAAEMPDRSPLEALKAQAVLARTHALHLKIYRGRHRADGYDLCDEQHCQVYAGVRAETVRSRAVVEQTRGRVILHQGRPAHVVYSSNCGGHSQSSWEVGWGRTPYLSAVSDGAPAPAGPADLRTRLEAWPEGSFCRPSAFAHRSHARWTRIISAKALEERLGKRLGIGRLLGLRVERRAASGHAGSVLVLGSRRNARLDDEIRIRSLLAVGSLRSTLFTVTAEYRPEPSISPAQSIRPRRAAPPPPLKLVLDSFVFRGGGWGHGVGFCQEGAMGRAEAGQGYEDILRAYLPGAEGPRLDAGRTEGLSSGPP